MKSAVEVRDLTIVDGRATAIVSNVSFSVASGEALVIIGETGSGKSLVAQALMGLLPPGLHAFGDIRFGNDELIPASAPSRLRRLWAESVMLLPQEPREALDPTMRIGRQLAGVTGATSATVGPALATFDLAEQTAEIYPHMLSGGMAQRVLLSTMLLSKAPVVIADEPTKGLDGARVAQTVSGLASLMRSGRALVVITHELALAKGIGGSLLVLKDGRAIEVGPTDRILADPRHGYTREWLAADPDTWTLPVKSIDRRAAVVSGENLSFAYPRSSPLFNDLSVQVPRGSILAVVGPSGCGKTTLGSILLGLQRPQAGIVRWNGAEVHGRSGVLRQLRRRFQKLHQDPGGAFAPFRTIRQHMLDLADARPEFDPLAALAPVLDRLKLRTALLDRYPGEISGGEAQRLALARILLLDPLLIVADEPTSRLDPVVQKDTIFMLRAVADEGSIGIVLISHSGAIVRAVADTMIAIG